MLRFTLPCHIAVTYLVTGPIPARACWSCGGALCILRFALLRYTPRCTGVTYLVTDPTPAHASDPPFCHGLALRWQLQISSWSCGGVLCVLRLC